MDSPPSCSSRQPLRNNTAAAAKWHRNTSPDQERKFTTSLATENGRLEVSQLLLRNCANIRANDQWEWAPLHLAARNGHLQVAQLLLRNCADIRATNQREWTPLHLVARNGHLEVAQVLLRNGAEIQTSDQWECTCLFTLLPFMVAWMLPSCYSEMALAYKQLQTICGRPCTRQ